MIILGAAALSQIVALTGGLVVLRIVARRIVEVVDGETGAHLCLSGVVRIDRPGVSEAIPGLEIILCRAQLPPELALPRARSFKETCLSDVSSLQQSAIRTLESADRWRRRYEDLGLPPPSQSEDRMWALDYESKARLLEAVAQSCDRYLIRPAVSGKPVALPLFRQIVGDRIQALGVGPHYALDKEEVEYWSAVEASRVRTTITGADGRYRFEGLPPDVYAVIALWKTEEGIIDWCELVSPPEDGLQMHADLSERNAASILNSNRTGAESRKKE